MRFYGFFMPTTNENESEQRAMGSRGGTEQRIYVRPQDLMPPKNKVEFGPIDWSKGIFKPGGAPGVDEKPFVDGGKDPGLRNILDREEARMLQDQAHEHLCVYDKSANLLLAAVRRRTDSTDALVRTIPAQ